MILLSVQRRRIVSAALVLCWTLAATSILSAGQNPFKWLTGGDKSIKYMTYKDPAGRFELEYPQKDWRILPSGVGSSLVFSRSDGPSVFIDRATMSGPLTAPEVEAMAGLEVDRLKEEQPNGRDFKSEMLEGKSGRGVLIRYSRPGAELESVIQYSIPVARDLYRLIGVTPVKLLAKNEEIIMHMIQSFKAAGSPSTTKD
jgi:hypothetical protein